MMKWLGTALYAVGGVFALIVGGNYLFSTSEAGRLDRQVREGNAQVHAKWEADACRTALPEAKDPKPVWRSCSRFEKCFHCVDDRGVLHPVRPPHCGPNQSCE